MSKKSWPILYSKWRYEMGQDFLDTLYITIIGSKYLVWTSLV